MTKDNAGRRGHGVFWDTVYTTLESLDGLLFSAAIASKWLWRRRIARNGGIEPVEGQRPSLWAERSVKVETFFVILGVLISLLTRSGLIACLVPILTYAVFLVAESTNTALEWLIDEFQAQVSTRGERNVYVGLIKHVASGMVLAINFSGGLAWLLLVLQ